MSFLIYLLCSIFGGTASACYFVSKKIKNSNDIGDSSAKFEDFGPAKLTMNASEDM